MNETNAETGSAPNERKRKRVLLEVTPPNKKKRTDHVSDYPFASSSPAPAPCSELDEHDTLASALVKMMKVKCVTYGSENSLGEGEQEVAQLRTVRGGRKQG